MNDPNNEVARTNRAVDAEQRRWLIGIGISLAFGTFGAVMAWLSYSARTRAQAPTSVQVARPGSDESPHPGGPRRRKSSEHR
jgi:hypothetical protein